MQQQQTHQPPSSQTVGGRLVVFLTGLEAQTFLFLIRQVSSTASMAGEASKSTTVSLPPYQAPPTNLPNHLTKCQAGAVVQHGFSTFFCTTQAVAATYRRQLNCMQYVLIFDWPENRHYVSLHLLLLKHCFVLVK